MLSSTVLFALATSATAKMIDVAIGGGGNLVYVPDTVTAAMGDVIRFSWPSSIMHNVVSSDFDSACMPNGMIAAPVMGSGGMDFFVQVNSTDPMYFYCSVSDHCNDGMVMAVNPSSDQPLAMYMSAAASASIAQPSPTSTGGVLAAATAMPFAAAATGVGASASTAGSSATMSAGMAMSSASSAAASAAGNAAPKMTGIPVAIGAAAVGLGMLL